MEEVWLCVKCQEYKPRDQFYRCASRPSGYRYECKLCTKASNVRRYANSSVFRDQSNTRAKQYYANNKTARRAYASKYQKNNRNKRNAIKAARRARERGAFLGATSSVRQRESEIRATNHCVWCGHTVTNIQVDHIWPLSKGGQHAAYNLQGLCAAHNAQKGGRVLLQLELHNG